MSRHTLPRSPKTSGHPKGYRSADEFLEMRLQKISEGKAQSKSKSLAQNSYLHAFWIGAAMVLWGMLQDELVVAKLGLIVLFLGFVIHFKSKRKRKIPGREDL